MRTQLPESERLAYNVEELPQLLHISRSTAYELVRSGRVRSVRYGARYIIPKAAIEEFLGNTAPDAPDAPEAAE